MRRDAERELHEVQGQVDVKRTELDATNRDLAESTERLECLRQEIEELEPAAQTVAEGVRTLWKARSDGSREEELGRDIEGLRTRISDLSSQIADVDRRADEIERGLPRLRARRASLGERFESARAGVVKALEGLREVPNIVSAWAQELARKMGKPLFDPNSIDYRMREMREAARPLEALSRSHEAPTRSRGHGAR